MYRYMLYVYIFIYTYYTYLYIYIYIYIYKLCISCTKLSIYVVCVYMCVLYPK